MPEMFMIAVMQVDMCNTKCTNPAHCSAVTTHLSTLLTATPGVCTRVSVSARVKSAFVRVCAHKRHFTCVCVCVLMCESESVPPRLLSV